MVYECAQGQLASWKVTECNLVNHKLDMQAAADRESYTHTQHTSKQALSLSHTDTQSVLQERLRKATNTTLYCVSHMLPQIHVNVIIMHSHNQSHWAGPANMIWTHRTSECSNNFHVRLGEDYSEIMEPLPALSFFGLYSCSSWLINLWGLHKDGCSSFFFCWRMLPPTGNNCTLQPRKSF